MLAAAPRLRPTAAGIVSLSGSGFAGTNGGKGYGNLDANAAVRKLRVPLLLVAAKEDTEALTDARILFKASASPDKRSWFCREARTRLSFSRTGSRRPRG